MLFNSIDFAIFLPIVFLVYWFALGKNYKAQNILLFIASYLFYGWWDWRFLLLIVISTCVDYLVGIGLSKTEVPLKRKYLLSISLVINLGMLGFFKYWGFFVDNFVAAFTLLGQEIQVGALSIILPIGISFYTLQTLSYTIDVYKRKIEPTKDFFAFASFVSFFPQLVAGPIERAKNLMPQFTAPRIFSIEKATDGMRQILWGFFCKLVIADNCGMIVDQIFIESANYSGSALLLGAMLFAIQVYCDFAGYSHIAIGVAALFGFTLMQNFAYPFFSRDIAELWRKWHISLTTWIRDYIFLPLTMRNRSRSKLIGARDIFIVFLITGFWHGANWTYVIWGGINALYVLPSVFSNKRRHKGIVAKGKILPSGGEFVSMAVTFVLFAFASIFFRSEGIEQAFIYLSGIFSVSLFTMPNVISNQLILVIGVFFLLEWFGRGRLYAFANVDRIKIMPIRWLSYTGMISLIVYFMLHQQRFVYFQF